MKLTSFFFKLKPLFAPSEGKITLHFSEGKITKLKYGDKIIIRISNEVKNTITLIILNLLSSQSSLHLGGFVKQTQYFVVFLTVVAILPKLY